MKFTVQRSELNTAIRNGMMSLFKQSPTVLRQQRSLRFEATQSDGGGRLVVWGTDGTTAVLTETPTRVDEEGAISIPADLLRSVVDNTNDDLFHFEVADTQSAIVEIRTAKCTAHINSFADAYYTVPQFSAASLTEFELPGYFLGHLATVAEFASNDYHPEVLTCIQLLSVNGKFRCACADGFRLGIWRAPLTGVQDFDVVLPVDAIQQLRTATAHLAPDVPILVAFVGQETAKLVRGNVTLMAMLPSVTFPNYIQLLSARGDWNNAVTLSADLAFAGVKRASKFTFKENRAVSLKVGMLDTQIEASTFDNRVGSFTETIPGGGGSSVFDMRMSADFLADTLEAFKGKDVEIGDRGERTPIAFQESGADGESGLYCLVMPMHVEK